MSTPAFRNSTAIALVVVCTISLVGLGLLAIFGPELEPTRSGQADVYSMSAVGHGALHDVLEELDVPTDIHRSTDRLPLGGNGVLLLLEPAGHLLEPDDHSARPGIEAVAWEAPAVLLALPKWQVALDNRKQPWVVGVAPLTEKEVLAPLHALGIGADPFRPFVPDPEPTTVDRYGHAPTFPTSWRQYLMSDAIEPLVADRHGTILGFIERRGVPIYVLSDPDLLANHGLHRGRNATMVMAWIDAIRRGGPVVFDETLHGFPPRDESLLRAFFRFPLVLVLLHALVLVGLVLWAGLGRFGDAPPPKSEIEPGSGFLIRHTAWLLQFGRHGSTALGRYVDDTATTVAARFHLPSTLTRTERDARLDELGETRDTRERWTALRTRAVQAAEAGGPMRDVIVLRAAHALHAWKQEILDGPRSDSRTTPPTA